MTSRSLVRLRKLSGQSLHSVARRAAVRGLIATRLCAFERGRLPLSPQKQAILRQTLIAAGRERLKALEEALQAVEAETEPIEPQESGLIAGEVTS